MCQFCENIYPEEDVKDIVFGRGKYKNIAEGGSFITPDAFISVNTVGELDIITMNPDEAYEFGWLCDIKFCPYCGRNLKELVGTFHCKAEESGWRDILACNDCPNKCEEWYRWDKEFKSVTKKEDK